MVAFHQNLIASANAHHAMPEVVDACRFVTRAQKYEQSEANEAELKNADSELLRVSQHQSPAPTGAVSIRAGTTTLAGTAFGIKATTVPTIITHTPIHIHITSGFK